MYGVYINNKHPRVQISPPPSFPHPFPRLSPLANHTPILHRYTTKALLTKGLIRVLLYW